MEDAPILVGTPAQLDAYNALVEPDRRYLAVSRAAPLTLTPELIARVRARLAPPVVITSRKLIARIRFTAEALAEALKTPPGAQWLKNLQFAAGRQWVDVPLAALAAPDRVYVVSAAGVQVLDGVLVKQPTRMAVIDTLPPRVSRRFFDGD